MHSDELKLNYDNSKWTEWSSLQLRQASNVNKPKLERLIETTLLTYDEIANQLNTSQTYVWRYISRTYSKEFMKERKTRVLIDKRSNRAYHETYGGWIGEGGYVFISQPEWYTARTKIPGQSKVRLHRVVMCEYLGLSELPEGFEVHHIDKDKTNNDIHNLCVVTRKGHRQLHES